MKALVLAVCLLCTACGMLTGALAAVGVPGARSAAANDAAKHVDDAVWSWLYSAVFGVAGAAAADQAHRRRNRKTKKVENKGAPSG